MQVFESFAAIVSALIPPKDAPASEWIPRYLALFLSGVGTIVIAYVLLHDTEIGRRYGMSKLVIPQTMPYQMAKINSVAYANLLKLRQEQDQVSAVFMFLGFSDIGNVTFLDKASAIVMVSGSSSITFLPEDINDGWRRSASALLPKIKTDTNDCVSSQVQNAVRLKRALPGIDSDRVVICPISSGDRAIGFVAAFWKNDSKKLGLELDIKNSVKTAADLTEDYILLQKILVQN